MKHSHLLRNGYLLAGVGIFLLFIVTRLVNLSGLPIFTDEAIYIRWSQIGSYDASWRFISLTDGKQPLFTWIMMVLLRVFSDPLIAGRMVSFFAGIVSLAGITLLSYELFKSKKITALTAFLYVICPFSLMYDRLALYDSLSAALSLWSLYFGILLVKKRRLDLALLLGIFMGLSMINKTSGFLNLYMQPVLLLLADWKSNHKKRNLAEWIFFVGVAFIVSQAIYGILRLSPYYHMIAQKDFVFVHPLKNFAILYPFFIGNLKGLFDWQINYLTLPIFLSAAASIFFLSDKRKELLLVLMWSFAPLFALAYFGKVLYPRFILFMTLPLLMLAAVTIHKILLRWKNQFRMYILQAVILFPSLYASYFIVTNPIYAPIPYSDRGQMIDDWPAGGGVKDINEFIGKEAKKGKISIFTEGTFGLFPYAIEIYYWNNSNVAIKGLWPVTQAFPEEVALTAAQYPTYLIINQSQSPPKEWPLEFIAEYQKGTNKDMKMRLYKVTVPLVSELKRNPNYSI